MIRSPLPTVHLSSSEIATISCLHDRPHNRAHRKIDRRKRSQSRADSHRRAVASALSCLTSTLFTRPEPVTSTTPADVDVESSSPGPALTRTSTKRPSQLSSHGTLDTDDDAAAAEDVPKAKRTEDPWARAANRYERLNKTDPTADIKAFSLQYLAYQVKTQACMQCNPQGLGCPKQDKILTSEHSTLRRHAAALHAQRYRKWCSSNNFDSMLPRDSKQRKPKCKADFRFSNKALETAALEWLIETNQPIQTFDNAAFKKMLDIASRAPRNTPIFDSPHPGSQDHASSRCSSNSCARCGDRLNASNCDAYFAVTGHWIEERAPGKWTVEQALLGFVQMNQAHNGKRLGRALYKVCKPSPNRTQGRAPSPVTNAKNNDTMLQEFARCYELKTGSSFDVERRHISSRNLSNQPVSVHRNPVPGKTAKGRLGPVSTGLLQPVFDWSFTRRRWAPLPIRAWTQTTTTLSNSKQPQWRLQVALPTQPRNNHCDDSEPGRRTSTAADALTTHYLYSSSLILCRRRRRRRRQALHQPVLKLRAPPSMATTVGTPLTQLRASTTPTTTTAAAGSQPTQRSAADYYRHSANDDGRDHDKATTNPGEDATTTTTVAPTTTLTTVTGQSSVAVGLWRLWSAQGEPVQTERVQSGFGQKRCLAHIINLATQALITTRSKSKFYDGNQDDDDLPEDLGASVRDEVGLIRTICVKVIDKFIMELGVAEPNTEKRRKIMALSLDEEEWTRVRSTTTSSNTTDPFPLFTSVLVLLNANPSKRTPGIGEDARSVGEGLEQTPLYEQPTNQDSTAIEVVDADDDFLVEGASDDGDSDGNDTEIVDLSGFQNITACRDRPKPRKAMGKGQGPLVVKPWATKSQAFSPASRPSRACKSLCGGVGTSYGDMRVVTIGFTGYWGSHVTKAAPPAQDPRYAPLCSSVCRTCVRPVKRSSATRHVSPTKATTSAKFSF
ncbi:hypothetical protein EDB84DRAFT_1444172 [Lactarius hengduanensis]|nr:hypothetical protein EDB84DRAFT_1444172 [Lactarius hengduanensis]